MKHFYPSKKRLNKLGIYEKYLKRTFDLIISYIALSLLSPFLIAVAVRIKREDGGSIFYRGERVGLNGKPFKILKFRTMVVNADKIGGPSTAEDDPRITKVGKTLRKYKIDELPQLINVAKGEMSLVGPRPEITSEVETYSEKEKRILCVRPGITDWASIEFRNEGDILKGSLDPHEAYRQKIKPEKIKLALKYVNSVSFKTDISIIVKTAYAVIFSG